MVTCGEVTVQFTANGETQCRLDSGSFTGCTSPYHQSGLHGGQHVITVRTSDGRDGYKQDSVSFHVSGMSYAVSLFLYDTWHDSVLLMVSLYDKPMLTWDVLLFCIVSCYTDPVQLRIHSPSVTGNSVQLHFTSSAPTQCQLDQYDYAPCRSPYRQTNLKSGQHSITVRATDKAGCQQEDSATFYIAGKLPTLYKEYYTLIEQIKLFFLSYLCSLLYN